MKNKRIFEIPLGENIKHSGFKIRVDNRLGMLTLSCSLSDRKGSCNSVSEDSYEELKAQHEKLKKMPRSEPSRPWVSSTPSSSQAPESVPSSLEQAGHGPRLRCHPCLELK
jgi:hypothetical protein